MRKDLLASSLRAVRAGKDARKEAAPAEAAPLPEVKPRRLAGVLDVQRGLDQLAAGAARPVDTAEIADSAIRDRFDVEDGLDDLVASIKASGQRLPVLLRRISGAPLPYEVVYGRRRIAACRRLGIAVQAHIAEMDEREALISQGLENAARLQRSFIEQAVYARRLLDHGLSRDEITEILAVDKTILSRMLGVVATVPAELVAAIGPAHEMGRRPWQDLRAALEAAPGLTVAQLLAMVPPGLGSGQRLQAVLAALAAPKPVKPAVTAVNSRSLAGGFALDQARGRLTIRGAPADIAGFSAFLDQRLDGLLAEYLALTPEDKN